jgi:hypothetical protein
VLSNTAIALLCGRICSNRYFHHWYQSASNMKKMTFNSCVLVFEYTGTDQVTCLRCRWVWSSTCKVLRSATIPAPMIVLFTVVAVPWLLLQNIYLEEKPCVWSLNKLGFGASLCEASTVVLRSIIHDSPFGFEVQIS